MFVYISYVHLMCLMWFKKIKDKSTKIKDKSTKIKVQRQKKKVQG